MLVLVLEKREIEPLSRKPLTALKTGRSALGSAGWVGATSAALADPSSL